MQITAIESLQWAEYARLLVVRVHTDAGIVGLGVNLNPSALKRADLTRELSSGAGLAEERRAMGDHWAVEAIR